MRPHVASVAFALAASACCVTAVGEGGGSSGGGSSTGSSGTTTGESTSAGTSGGSGTGGTSGGCAGIGQGCGFAPVTPCCSGLSCTYAFNDSSVCEPPCQADTDCPTGNYCDLPLGVCAGGLEEVTAGQGYCHRDCFTQGCACFVDADCPGGSCNLGNGVPGTCVPTITGCPAPHCASECPQTSLLETACPICLCQSCPAPDGGASGPACGFTPDAGSCTANQVCCEAWGGTFIPDGGPNSEGCDDLAPDGGCPPGAVCAYDSAGNIESCNFYYP